jgi:hypothetical protein
VAERGTYRIYVSRDLGLRPLPGDYEDLEAAKRVFEKHHGDIGWCLVARIEPATERPTYVLQAEAAGTRVEWRHLT